MEALVLEADDTATRLVLTPVLDLRMAAPLRDRLMEALDLGHPLTLEAGAVERLTTPCLQVLVAAAHSLQARDIPFTVSNPPEAMMDVFRELGLFATLMQWKLVSDDG